MVPVHPNLAHYGMQLRRLHDIPDGAVLEIVDDRLKPCEMSKKVKRILASSARQGLDRWDSDDAIDTEAIPSPPSAPLRHISDTCQPLKTGEQKLPTPSVGERSRGLARINSFDDLWAEEDIAPPPSLPTRMISGEVST